MEKTTETAARRIDLFIVCGETSGDLLAAKLLAPLQEKVCLAGVLGPELRKRGAIEFFPMEAFQVMGFFTLLPHLPRLIRLFYAIKQKILALNPKVVLLVDNAEFSLLMAKALRRAGFSGKIVQLVSPSIWAWRKGRKKTMESTLDALFTLFPFEPPLFKNSSLDTLYIGHPLVESLQTVSFKKAPQKCIALFPGSRRHEIRLNLPLMLQSVQHVRDHDIAVSVSSPEFESEILSIIQTSQIPCRLVSYEKRYELMQETLFALSKLGTINLELAFFEVPTITLFVMPRLERWILQYGFQVFLPHYSIVNWIAGRRLFPEYVGPFAHIENVRREVDLFLENPTLSMSMIAGCQEVKKSLSGSHTPALEKLLAFIKVVP